MIGKMYENPENNLEEDFDSVNEKEPEIKTNTVSLEKSKASIFAKGRKKIKEFYRSHKVDFKYLLLAIPIVVAFFIFREVQKEQSLKTAAALHQASVYFQIESWTLPPESTFEVWVNSDSAVAFSDIEITFDPGLVKLTSEITTYESLSRIIKVTSMNDANSKGKVSIVTGLDPGSVSTPPSGTFRIASFKLDANTANSAATTVNFDNANMQLVSTDQSVFTTTVTGLSLDLNPESPPTSAPAPTLTPTATPKPAATPTPSPKASYQPTTLPTSTLTPVSTSKPTSTKTPTPVPTYTQSSASTTKYQVSGVVINSRNSRSVGNATIKFKRVENNWWRRWWQRDVVAKTDAYGHFGVYLPPDNYYVTVSKSGFRTVYKTLLLRTNTILNFQVSPTR